MSAPEPSEWLAPIAAVLDRLSLRYVVIGAVAAAQYRAVPRTTTDLDLCAQWSPDLPLALEEVGYDVQVTRTPGEPPHLLVARRPGERIDLLFPVVSYQDLALSRGLERGVLTVEDVIVHKLLAWRARDRDDVRSILAAGHDLDESYIGHWAAEWEVADRWEAALAG